MAIKMKIIALILKRLGFLIMGIIDSAFYLIVGVAAFRLVLEWAPKLERPESDIMLWLGLCCFISGVKRSVCGLKDKLTIEKPNNSSDKGERKCQH